MLINIGGDFELIEAEKLVRVKYSTWKRLDELKKCSDVITNLNGIIVTLLNEQQKREEAKELVK